MIIALDIFCTRRFSPSFYSHMSIFDFLLETYSVYIFFDILMKSKPTQKIANDLFGTK